MTITLACAMKKALFSNCILIQQESSFFIPILQSREYIKTRIENFIKEGRKIPKGLSNS